MGFQRSERGPPNLTLRVRSRPPGSAAVTVETHGVAHGPTRLVQTATPRPRPLPPHPGTDSAQPILATWTACPRTRDSSLWNCDFSLVSDSKEHPNGQTVKRARNCFWSAVSRHVPGDQSSEVQRQRPPAP